MLSRCRAVAQLSSHLLTETRGVPVFSRLGKLRPRILFTGAEGKGHGCGEQRRPIDQFYGTVVKSNSQ